MADITTSNWARFRAMMNPQVVGPLLDKELRRTNQLIAAKVIKEIRNDLRKGIDPPNAKLTIFIKRSKKSLIDDGDLFGALTWHEISPHIFEVGILRTAPGANVAIAAHEGATIPVTAAMRAMFRMLWMVSKGNMDPDKLTGRARELWDRYPRRGWRPLKDSTTNIIIPGRPFIRNTIENKQLLNTIAKPEWEKALERALQQAAASGGSNA